MRESHSLVTREALLRGVPVVVTDTIGPEEVVDDGVNGLVVPAGDPAPAGRRAALARRPVGARDPATGRGQHPPEVRSIDEQVAGLDGALRAPRVRAAVGAVHRRAPTAGPVRGRHRRRAAALPRPPARRGLALHGVHSDVRHYRDPDVAHARGRADVVVVYRVPATPQVLELIAECRSAGAPVVFDVDDLIFDPDIADEIPALRLPPAGRGGALARGRRALPHDDGGLRRVHRLDAAAGRARPTRSWASTPTCSRTASASASARRATSRSARRVRRDRSGSATSAAPPPTTTTGATSRRRSSAVLEAHPDAELWLGGHLRPDRGGARAARRSGAAASRSAPWHRLPDLLRDSSTSTWRRSSPAAASTTPRARSSGSRPPSSRRRPSPARRHPFRDAIEHGRTGWLADDPAEWATSLEQRPPGR